jgi:hypothetical protein
LDGEYEVGLCDFIYPHSWNNFVVNNSFAVSISPNSAYSGVYIKFSSGYYANETELIKKLNQRLETNAMEIKLKYTESNRRVTLQVADKSSVPRHLFLTDSFRNYFGFEKENPFTAGEYTSNKRFDANSAQRIMYLYSDIAGCSAVGDTRSPLLRVCGTRGSHGDTIHESFVHPQYVPVARRDIETIEVLIYNELGTRMPFQFGKAVVTLHFRRKHEEAILL